MITAMPKKGTETTAASYLKKKELDAEWTKAKEDTRNISPDDQPIKVVNHDPSTELKAVEGSALDSVKVLEEEAKQKHKEEMDKAFKDNICIM